MRNWNYDGWSDRDWIRLESTAGDLHALASEFDKAIGGGGGGFEPQEVAEFAERLEVIQYRLSSIAKDYL